VLSHVESLKNGVFRDSPLSLILLVHCIGIVLARSASPIAATLVFKNHEGVSHGKDGHEDEGEVA